METNPLEHRKGRSLPRNPMAGNRGRWIAIAKDKTANKRELFFGRKLLNRQIRWQNLREKLHLKTADPRIREEVKDQKVFLDRLIKEEHLGANRAFKRVAIGAVAGAALALTTHVETAYCPDKSDMKEYEFHDNIPDKISYHFGPPNSQLELGAIVLRDIECHAE